MEHFLVYMLKSALCLATFYVFYRWLLSGETFHRLNRLTLLGICLLSWVLPSLEVATDGAMGISRAVWALEDMLLAEWNQHEMQEDVPWDMGTFYVLGVLFLLVRYLYSLGRMFFLLQHCKIKKQTDSIRLFLYPENIAPFSWMRIIVMSEKDWEDDRVTIFAHEYAHIRKGHSWDLLLVDVCLLLQWFNPAVWWLKKDLKAIHEYEADEYVIRQGIHAKEYQLLLIKKAVGTRLYSMANSLNHSSLKKRITMMIKKKSNPWARLKYLYVLPLATVSVIAFARSEVSNRLKEISEVKVNDLALNAKAVETKSVKNFSESQENQPLVLVDGIRKRVSELRTIHPETIESMYIWKGEEAIKQYGEAGRLGVIEIKLKKGGL
ncbi:MAG: M56 family peptidase [Bacteroides sp.]|nr:M56 family peptidase [Bacteroides sp.]